MKIRLLSVAVLGALVWTGAVVASSPDGQGKKTRPDPPKRLIEDKAGVTFILIPQGTFTMGCTREDSECESDEKPSHLITLRAGFYMAETETTVGQYRNFVSATNRALPPSPGLPFEQGDDHPVVNVDWNDAVAFCGWIDGRLPTEAEWEYAARAGRSDWRYPWGNWIMHENANYDGTGGRDSWAYTSPVKSFAPNGHGLYDMAGNAFEWVADWYGMSYYGSSASDDPKGPSSGDKRVVRGGCWGFYPKFLRVSARTALSPGVRDGAIFGFRCARNASP